MATRWALPEEPQLQLEDVAGHPLQWQVRLRPHEATVYVSQGRTVLATSTDGFVFQHKQHGLWVYQARTLNRYRWLINGEPPRVVGASNLDQHCWMGYYIAPLPNYKQTETKDPNPTQHTIELRLVRFIGEGMREDVYVTNHNQVPTKIRLELEVGADFADPTEAGGKRKQRGKLTKHWRQVDRAAWELAYDYRAEHKYAHQGDRGVARLHRGLRLRLDRASSPPKFSKNKIQFEVELPPHGTWYACLGWFASVDGKELPLEYAGCAHFQPLRSDWDAKRVSFLQEATAATGPGSGTLAPIVFGAFDRARRDLAALRLYDLDGDQGAWTLAAGLPSYVSLFGRDTLASSWESLLLASEMTRGTLQRLSEHQADRVDNWRDEQPGKIVHEIHTEPLSVLNFNPHGLYFGGVTGAIYYPVVLAGLWHWTGDKELVRRYVDTALRGLHWADTYGDLDRDGFYEYQTYSEQGEKNQGWKDSGDAIVYADGRQVKDPLGTCEMQAFVYASKMHLSEVLWWQGRADLAQKFFDEAVELKKRFNDKFWMEDEGFIAMAMDGQKRLVRSIASDPGHCLASGIVETDHVPRLAKRLMSEEMYSGWGIRTLSSRHPAYNPFSYHRGSVWPVENGVFVLAFARYGLHKEMWQLARTLFEAAALFDYFRLPEVFAGHQRDQDHPFPGLYPNANWPQAWSASAIITIVQSLVGLYPYAPLNALLLDPHLPDWLPEITLHHIRVAGARVTLRFRRKENGETEYEVLDLEGKLHILRQPSPWSLTADFGERVKDAILSLLPGH